MIDYVVTDRGRAFFFEALQECARTKVSWFQLWSPAVEAQVARARLELFDTADYSEETARLLGVYAVIETLHDVAAGRQDVGKATMLLERAGLLTNDIIDPAATLLNMTRENLWGVFAGAVL